MIKIWTDGSVRKDLSGGWAFVIAAKEPDTGEYRLASWAYGGVRPTTVNKMELTAILEALKATPVGAQGKLITDSLYCQRAITEWYSVWMANNYERANLDLIGEIYPLYKARNIEIVWQRRNTDAGQTKADYLAKSSSEHIARQLDSGKNYICTGRAKDSPVVWPDERQ